MISEKDQVGQNLDQVKSGILTRDEFRAKTDELLTILRRLDKKRIFIREGGRVRPRK